MGKINDTTFRTKTDSADNKPAEFKETKGPKTPLTTKVEVPHTSYQAENGRPYTADHYDLGELWNEGRAFNEEVGVIEEYIESKIRSGEWANDRKAVKRELAKIEKLTNMKDETRQAVKIGVVSEHIKFMNEVDGIKSNSAKYGNK